jgi:predicted nucleic acid-binding protein
MSKLGVNSVMLDTSFCIRLLDSTDTLHTNALDYFKHFREEEITIHLSTIAVAEYSVGDDPANLPIGFVQLETFDFRDAITAGKLHQFLYNHKTNIAGYNRRIIANDVKILAQISTRNIDGLITKDSASYARYIKPLTDGGQINLKFLDLNIPLATVLGQLFT